MAIFNAVSILIVASLLAVAQIKRALETVDILCDTLLSLICATLLIVSVIYMRRSIK